MSPLVISMLAAAQSAAGGAAGTVGDHHLDIGRLLAAGFLGTIVLTTMMAAAQGLRWSRISLPLIVGTIFVAGRERALVAGSAIHVLYGTASAFVYAPFFELWSWPGWWFGPVLGLSHGLFTLTVLLPIAPGFHPLMADERRGPSPTRGLQPPGFLCLNYGWGSAVSTLAAHVAYGVVFGLLYTAS